MWSLNLPKVVRNDNRGACFPACCPLRVYSFLLTCLLQRGHGGAAFLHHLPRDLELLQFLLARQVEHQVQHKLFQDHAQPTRAHFASHSLAGDGAQSLVTKLQAYVLELEQALVLLDDGILGASENLNQRKLVKIFEHADDGQSSDKFRNQAELDQIFRLDFAEQLKVALARDRTIFFIRLFAAAEAERLFPDASSNNLFQTYEGSAAYKEDIGGVDRSKFLVRMLASALRRNISNRSFQNLQQSLLHAFAGDIASNGRILVLAADLVDLIDIDDAGLSAAYIALGSLQQFEDDVLDVLAHITSFGERGDRKSTRLNSSHSQISYA